MLYKMPRVVSDQRAAFDSIELFKRLSRESEIKYAGFRDRTVDERRVRFSNSCQAGKAEISFVASGTNFVLHFNCSTIGNSQNVNPSKEYVNFDREPGKVYLMSPFILNGVCVCLKGWINLQRLEGRGSIEFDEERAQIEASQIPSTSGQQVYKVTPPKSQTHKHPASGGNSSQIDKRPRLH